MSKRKASVLILYSILTIFMKCTNIISRITFTEKLDHILGGSISLVEIMIIIWGVLAIIHVMSSIANLTVWIDKIDGIMLLRYLYRFNPIIYILK